MHRICFYFGLYHLIDINCVCDVGCSLGHEHFSLYVLHFFIVIFCIFFNYYLKKVCFEFQEVLKMN